MLDMLLYFPVLLSGLSFVYISLCLIALLRFRSRLNGNYDNPFQPSVTILKPVCGMEASLAENLRSFCHQEYEEFQIVFGVHNAHDPAISTIRELIAEFPQLDMSLVVDSKVVGSNYKVNNLANMMRKACHEIIVVADSDMHVNGDYLRAVVAPFKDPGVGAATCVYSGQPSGRVVSKLGALYINDWFLPSALIPAIFGRLSYCFGATMAVRRSNLEKIGSFDALANVLADDFMLGRLVFNQGYRVALIPYIVKNIIVDSSLKELFKHELRWARTIRSVEPLGYAASVITEVLPLACLASVCLYLTTGSLLWSNTLFLIAVVLRLALHYSISATVPNRGASALFLLPLRDLMSPIIRLLSYFGRRVTWRERDFVIQSDMRVEPAE